MLGKPEFMNDTVKACLKYPCTKRQKLPSSMSKTPMTYYIYITKHSLSCTGRASFCEKVQEPRIEELNMISSVLSLTRSVAGRACGGLAASNSKVPLLRKSRHILL